MKPYTYVTSIRVKDPHTNGIVDVEIWKDNTSGGIMGIDGSFLDQCDNFFNPFNGNEEVTDEVMPCDEVPADIPVGVN